MKIRAKFRAPALALCLAFSGVLGAASAAGAADVKPVLTVTGLMGAFVGGRWVPFERKVMVDGREARIYDVSKDEDLFTKLRKADEDGNPLACESPLAPVGTRLAYWNASGRMFEGTIKGASLTYEGEASDEAGFSIDVDGYDPDTDWSDIVVATAASVEAVTAPTKREDGGEEVVFSMDGADGKYSVAWKKSGDHYESAVTAHGKTWKIAPEGELAVKPDDAENIHCGFFDLDGDGTPELAAYDSGPNGSVGLYMVGSDGPKLIAWEYAGEE